MHDNPRPVDNLPIVKPNNLLVAGERDEIPNFRYKWGPPRPNNRCGPDYGDCHNSCCSTGGYCGLTQEHCTLYLLHDFRQG